LQIYEFFILSIPTAEWDNELFSKFELLFKYLVFMEFIIRAAKPDDTGIILGFICQLAEYEKLKNDVTASEEILYDSLFVKKSAEVLIAEEDYKPVGFAVYFHNFSTFKGKAGLYLEDLFVLPEHRGKGYGKKLFLSLIQIAKERGCERFDWSVLKWNEPSIKFYKSFGAEPLEDWVTFRLTKF